jgi:hypothetical protein
LPTTATVPEITSVNSATNPEALKKYKVAFFKPVSSEQLK